MLWRKWLVRGLVFSILGGLGMAGFIYQRWTNPAAIRQQVIDKLSAQLVGASVTLDSARLRLLGGIALQDLYLFRKDDPDRTELAYIPSAVLYHDKEQLMDGKLAIRKIQLYRPRLHVVRDRAGRLNLAGLLAPTPSEAPMPTLVVQDGTILFEDHQGPASRAPLEIKNFNLVLINDPIGQVIYRGSGKNDLLGDVQVQGTWQRDSSALALTVEAPVVTVGPALIDWLSAYVPQLSAHARQLEGTGAFRAELGYQPGRPHPASHDVHVRIKNGKLLHPQVPLRLDNIDATARCLDGEARLEAFTAQAGNSRVTLTGWARVPDPQMQVASTGADARPARADPRSCMPGDADFGGDLRVEQLPVTSELFARLPHQLQKLNLEYAPNGPINLTCNFSRVAGEWKKRFRVEPQNLVASFWKFPYPLEHITGTLDQEIDTQKHVDRIKVDLAGYAGAQHVFIKGSVEGEGPEPAVDITIWGDNLPMDAKLRAALSPVHQKLARSFQPAGLLNFQTFIHRPSQGRPCDIRYLITFHHASMRYDEFPYPLEEVTGVLDIREQYWEFRDFHGSHKGCVFSARGRSHPLPAGNRLDIEIRGRNLLLDAELESALKPELKKAWKTFQPSGRMNFTAQVDCRPDQPPEVDVSIAALGCGITPAFFPYALSELTGSFRYAKQWVRLEKMQARHGDTVLFIDEGKAYLKPAGGYWVDLMFLRGMPVVVDEDMRRALPPVLRDMCTTLHIKDPLNLKTRLTLDANQDESAPPVIFWDGALGVQGATIQAGVDVEKITGKAACRGTYNGKQLEGLVGNLVLDEATVFGQPFRAIQAQLEVRKETPNVLVLPGLQATIFGGEMYGPIRVELGPAPRYELNLTASRINLEEFGRHNLGPNGKISGLASARIYLTGQGSDLQNLSGRGSVDIPNGRLYNLPLLLDLFKFLRLRLPDGTAFEEARADFTISGPRVMVSRLDLFGNSVSLRGQGELNLDGSDIQLDFYAVWARIVQMLPPIIKEIPPAFSKNLLKIKMRGKIGAVQCTNEPVPVLVEPLKELLEMMANRRSKMTK